MNLFELLAELKRTGIGICSLVSGELLVIDKHRALTQSLRVCIELHKPALIEASIQRRAVVELTKQGYILVDMPGKRLAVKEDEIFQVGN